MDQQQKFHILIADESHFHYAETIVEEMAESAKARGTGIATRSPEYIREKMKEGKAVIALSEKGEWAGRRYCSWENRKNPTHRYACVRICCGKYGQVFIHLSFVRIDFI